MWAALAFVVAGAWSGSVWLGVVAAGVTAAFRVWWFPATACWWCGPRGGPKRRDGGGDGRNWHRCRVCGGSGERRRFGARIFGGVDD